MIPRNDLIRQILKPDGEDMFVVADQRVVAGKMLDEHHAARDDGNPYGWNLCEICGFGAVPDSASQPARHLPFAAGVDVIMRWVDSRTLA